MKRSAIPRRRAKPRRLPAVRCSFALCTKPPRAEGLCRTHLAREADRLWSLAVRARDGRCMAADVFPSTRCLGPLQADHLVEGRSYHATRYELDNGAALCAAHHLFVTHHDAEHRELAMVLRGPRTYERIHRKALTYERPDLAAVLAELRPLVEAA